MPDVQVLKEYLDATSLHKQIETVEVRSQQMLEAVDARQLKDTLQGQAFARTRRHGKYLFAELDGGRWLVMHFGMTGDLKYYKDGKDEPEYAQILFHFGNGYHLAHVMPRKLGEVRLVDHPDGYLTSHRGTDDECPRCGGPWEQLISNRFQTFPTRLPVTSN